MGEATANGANAEEAAPGTARAPPAAGDAHAAAPQSAPQSHPEQTPALPCRPLSRRRRWRQE
eukprot:9641726-Lingulodinium_polyedra.AAC.1